MVEPIDLMTTDGLRRRKKAKQKEGESSLEIISPALDESSVPIEGSTRHEEVTETEKKSFKEKCNKAASSVFSIFEQMAEMIIKFFDECSSDYRYITSQLAVLRKERARTVSESHRRRLLVDERDSSGKEGNSDEVSFHN